MNIAGVTSSDTAHWTGTPQPGGQCRVSYSAADGVKFIWSGKANISELTDTVNSSVTQYTAKTLIGYGKAAYFTKNIEINGKKVRVRSFYAGEGSTFQSAAEACDENPTAVKFTESEFYKIEQWDKYTPYVQAFAYFDLDENNNIKNYTLVTTDAIYYSSDGGKTWKLK